MLYPKAEVQRCIVHQIRSSLRFVSWKDRKAVAKDLKGIYTALNEKQALLSLDEFKHIWDKKYPNTLILLNLGSLIGLSCLHFLNIHKALER